MLLCLGMDRATELYRGKSGREYHDVKRAVPEQALPWITALRAAKLQRHVQSTDVVFEFGAGSGWNLARLNCARKLAFDEADFLRPRLEAAGATVVTHPAEVPDQSVDVVICHHALEHVLAPAQALFDMRRVLKTGGKLVLHVPWERERRYRTYCPSEPNHHLYTWNVQTLANLVVACGYVLVSARVRRYGYDRASAAIALRLLLGQAGFRLIRRVLIAVFPLFEVELVAKRLAEPAEK